jgi:hypothetical protein
VVSKKAAADLRTLLLTLNALPEAVRETVARRDPSHLVRYADTLCEQARTCDRHRVMDAGLWDATAVALRRTLGLLHVSLPAYLTHLPPGLARPEVGVTGTPEVVLSSRASGGARQDEREAAY